MVQASLTGRENTTSVLVPVGSIDSDGDGLLLDSRLKSRGRLGNINEVLKSVGGTSNLGLLARTILSSVSVVAFSGEGVL